MDKGKKKQKDHDPQNTAQTTKYGAIRTPLKTLVNSGAPEL
jgi:hypothetical protein